MDTIELIEIDEEYGFGTQSAVYIIINDVNLLLYEHKWDIYNGYYESYCFTQHGGLDSDEVFLPSKRFLGEGKGCRCEEGLTCILGCSCGIEYCNPFYVRIVTKESTVVWSDFTPGDSTQPLPELGPFEFDKMKYFAALTKR